MTAEQALWLEKARRNVIAARRLLKAGDSDIAASRAYYAMFYDATALLKSRGLSFIRHAAVIGSFGREFAASGLLPRELHQFLLDAENARHIGEYRLVEDPTASDVTIHIERAEQFVSAAEQYLSSLTSIP